MPSTQKKHKLKENIFNEKFPERMKRGERIARAPSYSTTRLDQVVAPPSPTPSTTTTDVDQLQIPTEPSTRRHSWSSTTSNLSHFGKITLSVTDFSYSRCSSVSNVHDLIEEQSSNDDDSDSDQQINERTEEVSTFQSSLPASPQKNYLSSPDSPQSYHNNRSFNASPSSPQFHHNKHLCNALGGPRRSSWTAGDRSDLQVFGQSSLSLRSSPRGSMSGSMELAVISEPGSGESTSSEDEGGNEGVEQSVKFEVEKLLRFNNSNNNRRRGTLACDGDVKQLGNMLTSNLIQG